MLSGYKQIKIELLYRKGLKAKEIKEKLDQEKAGKEKAISLSVISKYISTELKAFKDEHKKNAKKILFDKIEELYANGCNSVEISNKVNLAATTISQYTKVYFKHLREQHTKNSKLKLVKSISDLYENGFTTTEIGQELGISGSAIMNYTANLPEDIKCKHDANYKLRLDIRRENNRLFNQASNQAMCTRAAVKQNRQSYYTDKEGNLRFDIRRGALPCDMPAIFTVQF